MIRVTIKNRLETINLRVCSLPAKLSNTASCRRRKEKNNQYLRMERIVSYKTWILASSYQHYLNSETPAAAKSIFVIFSELVLISITSVSLNGTVTPKFDGGVASSVHPVVDARVFAS